MNRWKTVRVFVKVVDADRWHEDVRLVGVPADAALRPRHARQAVEILGIHPGVGSVTVWSDDVYGYAVYPDSHRKTKRTWLWDDEVAVGVLYKQEGLS